MSNKCAKEINIDIAFNCDDQIVSGLEKTAYIANRADIESYEIDATNSSIITAITMKTGKRFYTIETAGKTPFTGSQTNLEQGDILNTYTHDFAVSILDNSPLITDSLLKGLSNGEFVVIVENKYKSETSGKGHSAFQLYGKEIGLVAETIVRDPYSESTIGGWAVTLKETGAGSPALFFFDTDLATTKTAIQALIAVPTP